MERFKISVDAPQFIKNKTFFLEPRILRHQARLGIADLRIKVDLNEETREHGIVELMHGSPVTIPISTRMIDGYFSIGLRGFTGNLNNADETSIYLSNSLRKAFDSFALRRLKVLGSRVPQALTCILGSFIGDSIAPFIDGVDLLTSGPIDNIVLAYLTAHAMNTGLYHAYPDALHNNGLLLPFGPNIDGIAASLVDRRRLVIAS